MITPSKYCKQCGGKCCKQDTVTVTYKKYKSLEKYICKNKSPPETASKLVIRIAEPVKECIFLDSCGCRIPYAERPEMCKLYPIIVGMEIEPCIEISTLCPFNKQILKLNGLSERRSISIRHLKQLFDERMELITELIKEKNAER